MIPVVVLRPQPGWTATAAAARALGLKPIGCPLFTIVPRRWQVPAADSFDALLLGSANALLHLGPALAEWRGKPTYAVGARTAEAAAAAGLEVVATGTGQLQGVLGMLRPEHRRLLRPAGEVRVPVDPPAGVTIEERAVYASEPLPMPPALAEQLRDPAVVLLHSAEAARHFAAECARLAIARERLALAAIAPRAAAAAGEGWAAAVPAKRIEDAALLALAVELCQGVGGPRWNMRKT